MNIIEKLLTPNPYSRPQKPLKSKKAIVIHWVANPNSTALANKNFFESRKNGKNDYGSAHEIIDLDGSIIICLPDNEMAYGVGSKTYTSKCLTELGNYPNSCTYSIECTHIDWNGKMTSATYNSLVQRCAYLCIKWKLNPIKDLWTHQEVVGWKDCHRWFVNNPDKWILFKNDVQKKIDEILGNNKKSDNISIGNNKNNQVKYTLVKKNDKGQYVIELQNKLNKHGYSLMVDGDFGNKTESAVLDFQKKSGLVVDGIVGDKTWLALNK